MKLKLKRSISIRSTIIIVTVLIMLFTAFGIGTIFMSGWINSSNKIIAELSKQVNEDITNSIDSFVATPINIIESNVTLINDDIVDLHNEDERNKFFVSVLNSQDSYIYSFSYGTENGEYYGARRIQKALFK